MRLPNHIVLDFFSSKNQNTIKYWPLNFFNINNSNIPLFLNNQVILEKIKNNKHLETRIFKNEKFDLNFKTNVKQNFLRIAKFSSTTTNSISHINNLLNLVNTKFLRKEPIYTKLKYSRTAAYDLVGGGSALFLGGLLGFLITEKFGFEMVDSGDFYYLFMYGVFLTFALRPLLVIILPTKSILNAISLKSLIEFYNMLIFFVLNFFKRS